MPLYFPGFPGGLNTQAQFNDVGRFGGAPGIRYNKTLDIVGLNSEADISGAVYGILNLKKTLTPGVIDFKFGVGLEINFAPTVNSDGIDPLDILAHTNGAFDIAYNAGVFIEARHLGSGDVAEMYGNIVYSKLEGTGDVGALYGVYTQIGTEVIGSGDITTAYGFYVTQTFPSGPFGVLFQYYAHEAGGAATNAYSFWSDEQGVFRIRADNTFDSVYQAIPALYNPQFTKYTPGAANFERIILAQWNGNVAEIGTQAGGTGTLRALKFIGPSVQATSYKSNDGSTGATGSANATNTLTIKNGLVTNIA